MNDQSHIRVVIHHIFFMNERGNHTLLCPPPQVALFKRRSYKNFVRFDDQLIYHITSHLFSENEVSFHVFCNLDQSFVVIKTKKR